MTRPVTNFPRGRIPCLNGQDRGVLIPSISKLLAYGRSGYAHRMAPAFPDGVREGCGLAVTKKRAARERYVLPFAQLFIHLPEVW